MKDIWKFGVAIVVSLAAGFIGSFFTAPAVPVWYESLVKPTLNPPAWVFAPVWTTLFVLMGIAAFLVWRKGLSRRDVKIALAIFLGQLVLNTLWSIIFFGSTSLTINGLNNIGIALVEIVVLWFAILATMFVFYKISRPATWLLLPYILWVSFAVYLNYAIWVLN